MTDLWPYGRARGMINYPGDLDFVIVTNEDLGFTATLVAATNDNLGTTLPYPQEWDPDTEVCVLYKLQGWIQDSEYWKDDATQALLVFLSYLDRIPTATYRGVGTDANDEWMKAQFAGPMNVGVKRMGPSATAMTEAGTLLGQNQVGFEYVPEIPLSMFFPIYLDIVSNSATHALVTSDDTAASFSFFEAFTMRYYYRIRRMNRAERTMMEALSGAPVRWAQLGS